MYKNKIVHRDIKHLNILIDKDSNFKFADFGLSAQISEFITSRSYKPPGTNA